VRRASQRSTIDSRSPHRPGRFGLGSLVGPASPAPKTRFIRYAKLRHSLHRCSVTSSPRHPRRSLIGRRPVNSTIPFGSVSLRLMRGPTSWQQSALALQSRFPTRRGPLLPWEKPPLALLDSVAMRIGCRRGQVIPQAGWPTERRYRVLVGAAEKCAMLSDGRRQIVDLALRGDFFAFSTRTDG
jgi:hypothetical protein